MVRRFRLAALAALSLLVEFHAAPCLAQGMPVIDIANLIQAFENVEQDTERYAQLSATLSQLRSTHAALTGVRNLAAALNDPALQNYLPPASYTEFDAVTRSGTGGLMPRAREQRRAGMLYDCLDRSGVVRTDCQATLSLAYQYQAMVADAWDRSKGRVVQINALMRQAAATTDPKAIAEAQARLQGESALLGHEATQAQLAAMAMDADRQVRASRGLEAQLANLSRPVR